ncbi:MAG TPA: DUF4258 domain-containing protein [Flavobacterium sp.]|jgi:hypothetical protein
MKFYQRFAYYMLGLVIGLFVVAAIWSGKDTRCNYFPNSRVLNDLRNKPFHYSENAKKILSEGWIKTADVKNTLTYGDVDFDKSNVKSGSGKLYVIDGKTAKNQQITLEVVNYSDKAELINIVRR